MSKTSRQGQRDRSTAVGLILATAVIPRTFQPSLMRRDTIDQGIVTGLTMAMVYALSLLVQDGLNVASDVFDSGSDTDIESVEQTRIQSNKALFFSLATIGAGYALERANKYREDEKLPKSAARTAGMWLRNAGIAGVMAGTVEQINTATTQDKQKADNRNLLPYMIGIGLAYGAISEYLQARKDENFSLKSVIKEATPVKSVAMGVALAGILGIVGFTEHKAAGFIDTVVADSAPKLKKTWLPIGHVIAAGGLVFGMTKLMQKIMHDQEETASTVETGFRRKPKSPLVSGSSASLVSWDTLSLQGRRHVSTSLTAKQISNTLKETTTYEPIRVFVGLDSANSEASRVALALDELKRTGAYDRDVLVVISPTGTGYVNYILSESVEYLTRGNVASVTIQYSKRPSPLSLDRVQYGHVQYRMLLNGIKKELAKRPLSKRPRVVLFGESLGAWTSQDALMFEGTDGLEALGVDRALWIGTPYGSKWKEQIVANKWLNADENTVGVFDNCDQIYALPAVQRRKLRYIMLTHYNDPIAQFGAELLIKQPVWVSEPSKLPEGISSRVVYRSPTMFVQRLIDMKNALKPIPGKFVASGHDYRGDLAQAVSFCYNLKASPEQMVNIEAALRNNEVRRAKLISEKQKTQKRS